MLTKEWVIQHKDEIAAAMESPVRCGGAHWDWESGDMVYRFGGCLVPGSIVRQGSRAIEEYLRPIREALKAKREST